MKFYEGELPWMVVSYGGLDYIAYSPHGVQSYNDSGPLKLIPYTLGTDHPYHIIKRPNGSAP